jgi:predicted aminopeptidase
MVEEAWNGRDYYGGWVAGELNNAHLALVSTYQGGACAFSNLYRTAGENMERFMQLSAQTAALSRDDRDSWLQQACSAVAPGGDL